MSDQLSNFSITKEVIRVIGQKISNRANSILDVGPKERSLLQYFPNITEKVSIDKTNPFIGDGIESHEVGFLDWKSDRYFDISICYDGLHRVKSPMKIAQKLKSKSKITIVSVPYKIPDIKWAMHNNIDELTLFEWFGVEPNFQYICNEVVNNYANIIHVYEKKGGPWTSISERSQQRSRVSDSIPKI